MNSRIDNRPRLSILRVVRLNSVMWPLLLVALTFCSAATAQNQEANVIPRSDLAQENLRRVAASPQRIHAVLTKNPGLIGSGRFRSFGTGCEIPLHCDASPSALWVPLAKGKPRFRFSEAAGPASPGAGGSIDANRAEWDGRGDGPDAGATV